MNQASIQLSEFLFHVGTCGGLAFSFVSIVFFLIGFARTKLVGFLLLAIGLGGDMLQLLFQYVAFLRGYDLPPALKIAATGIYLLTGAVSLVGAIALAFGAQKAPRAIDVVASRSSI